MPIDPTAPLAQGTDARRAQFEADVRRRLDELGRRESGKPAVPWQDVTPTAPWSNYGSGFGPLGYCRTSTGVVHLRGMVKGGNVGETVMTLPEGFRPEYQLLLVGMHSSSAAGQLPLRIGILTGGSVSCAMYSPGATGYLSLDGISFVADLGPL